MADPQLLHDLGALAGHVQGVLAPALPYLLRMGEAASSEAAKKLGADCWEEAKTLWSRLAPTVQSRPATLEAADDVASNPDDEEATLVLRRQLRKLFEADTDLAAKVAELVSPRLHQRVAAATGSTIRDVEQDASGSVIVQQEVTAFGESIVEGVKQRQR